MPNYFPEINPDTGDFLSPLVQDAIDARAAAAGSVGHNHDDRYYTEAEADGRFVRTVNGAGPDGSGNVAVDAGSAVGDLDDVPDSVTRVAMTPAERTKLGNQSGTNTGDQTLPTWGTIDGKPAVVAGGADAAAARAVIGAGISDLALGTTSTTAKAGDYAPPAATLTAPGVVELATSAETIVGLDTTRAVTPEALRGAFYRSAAQPSDADAAAVINNELTTLSAFGTGILQLGQGSFKFLTTVVLPTGWELVGISPRATVITCATDMTVIRTNGGQCQGIRRLKIQSSFAGLRTTYDIEIIDPTKPVLEDLEILGVPQSAPNDTDAAAKGGILMRHSGAASNQFMPQLLRVWASRLVVIGVSDGHATDCYFWASSYGGEGAVVLRFDPVGVAPTRTSANGWTFTACDVIPPRGAGAGYLLDSVDQTKITGGYVDGSYSTNITGRGIHQIGGGRTAVTGICIYNCGMEGVVLEQSHGNVFSGIIFWGNNKADGAHPDIKLTGSFNNIFTNNSHSQPNVRTNKGAIYVEDSASLGNTFDFNVYDDSQGVNYAAAPLVVNSATQGFHNQPAARFSAATGTPVILTPPVCFVSLPGVAAWPAAEMAMFHRFTVEQPGYYRYGNIQIGTVASGNLQMAVVRVSGNTYNRVMNTGVIASPATGPRSLDMGLTFLNRGEYALVLWCDNTTANFYHTQHAALGAAGHTAQATLAGGIPASGTVTWNSLRFTAALTVSTFQVTP